MAFDLAAHLNVRTRLVRNLTRDGKPAKAVVASCLYDTDPADLWDALTSKERLPRSFLPVSGDLKLGGRYKFEGNAGGTITECVPLKRLAATWEFGDSVTWLTVTLTPEGEQTRLDLEHVAIVDPNFPPFGPGAVGVGWDLALMGMARHLSSPASVYPPEEAAGWATTPQGKDFVRQSATGWGEADIAAGEDPDKARASAEMTRQFYTGEMQPPS
ncbi:MAG: SRPBCC family protein [Devosia sp.]